jgi:hypothetical protein
MEFGFAIGFIEHLWIITTSNCNTRILLITTAHTKSCVCSLAIALCLLLTSPLAGDCLTTNVTVDSQLMTATAWINWLPGCCSPSPGQWFLVPSPTRLVAMFYYLVALGAFRPHPHCLACSVGPHYIVSGWPNRKWHRPRRKYLIIVVVYRLLCSSDSLFNDITCLMCCNIKMAVPFSHHVTPFIVSKGGMFCVIIILVITIFCYLPGYMEKGLHTYRKYNWQLL